MRLLGTAILLITFLGSAGAALAQTDPSVSSRPDETPTLASRLIATKSQAERAVILANKHLVTATLANELSAEGNRRRGKVPATDLLEIYTLELEVAEKLGDKKALVVALADVGYSFATLGRSAEAIETYERGLSISREIGHTEMTARLLSSLAGVYFGKDDQRALDLIEQSNLAAAQVDAKIIIAANLGRVGNFYAGKGDLSNALTYQQRAVGISEQLNNAEGVARGRVNIGIIQTMQGDYTRAEESLKKGLRFFDSTNDKERGGITLYNLGNVYLEMGDLAQAMTHYSRSLQNFEEINSTGGIEGVSTNIANLYIAQGNYQLARAHLDRASLIADKTGKTKPQYALGSYGDSYKGEGQFAKANEFYEKLLALKERSQNKDSIAETLINIGRSYLLAGDAIKAEPYFTRALRLSEETGNHVWLFQASLGIAESQLSRREFAMAFESANSAKGHSEKLLGSKESWEMYTALGRAKLGLREIQEARTNFEKAISIIEDRRDRVAGGLSERREFFSDKMAPYQLMAEILISQSSISEAFKYSELAKARSLLDAIGSGKVSINVSMTPEERVREQALRNELVSLAAQVDRESRKPKPDPQVLKNLAGLILKKRLASEDFHVQLFASHPELSVQRGQMNPASVAEIASLLPNEQSAYVEYLVAEGKTFLFIITKRGSGDVSLKAVTVDINARDLTKSVEDYRSITASGGLDFQKASRELYDLLIKPAERELDGKTNLIIVPDAVLWDLPFQALRDGRGRYLVEQVSISYAPSGTALKEMAKKTKARQRDTGLELLAFGNPVAGKETSERLKLVFTNEKLEPLPEAERLVNELGKLYGPTRSKILTGNAAREETAKTESPKYRIVQFATHGILNNVSPMYSHLVMSQDAKNSNEDGLLEAWELKDLDLKADMVILTACETARGKISNGEGVIGMTWASFIAGAPTTVASQWKVESSSTTELMLEFHRQLLAKERVSKAEALRRASLKLMKMPQYRHPSYWAGFVLVGDGS